MKTAERTAIGWGIFWLAIMGLILYSACGDGLRDASSSDGPLVPGDTLWFAVVALDSVGVEELPDTATVVLSYGDEALDVLTYPPAGDLQRVGSLNWLRGSYVIPSTWSHPWTLEVAAYGEVDGFPYGLIVADPTRVRVNARSAWVGTVDSSGVTATLGEAFPDSIRAVGTAYEIDEEIVATVAFVDSLTPGALADIWAASASNQIAIIDSTSCTPCGVYLSGGATVTGAVVYVTSGPAYNAQTDVVNVGMSVAGNYSIGVPLIPGVPDTFYVWAYRQGQFQPNGARVIIP